jgi:catechol 2,3-dioxygenase-like lactoylglutathione lyase family enzyme
MLSFKGVFSSFSVNDIASAKSFYENKLGVKVVEKEYMLELHTSGAGNIMVYPKPNHEPATYTVLNFSVSDIEQTVKQLKADGVAFESYDLPGIKTDENNIFTVKEMNIRQAWFKDPAGNILSVIEG